MFHVEDRVEIISDGRIGIIKNTHSRKDAANVPGAIEVIENCLVRFDNNIMKEEWFKPEQLRLVK